MRWLSTVTVGVAVLLVLAAGASGADVAFDTPPDVGTSGASVQEQLGGQRAIGGMAFLRARPVPSWLVDEIWMLPVSIAGGTTAPRRVRVVTIDDYSELWTRDDATDAATGYAYGYDSRGDGLQSDLFDATTIRDRVRDGFVDQGGYYEREDAPGRYDR